jgi:hypothetical protein
MSPIDTFGTSIRANGWTWDPDVPTQPVSVHFYVDGKWYARQTADINRPDVAQVFPNAGATHGFSLSAVLSEGTHTICAYAINVGIGTTNPRLGCGAVTLKGAPPVGRLQRATVSGGAVRLQGYALDPDSVDPVRVHVYVNGVWRTATTASVARPDVGAVFPAQGPNHGFDVTVPLDTGQNTVCVYAINLGGGYGNPQLGCTTLLLSSLSLPIGTIDGTTVVGSTLAVSGWALDREQPTQSVYVRLLADGRPAGTVLANRDRPDIAAQYPDAGPAHGWAGWLSLPAGTHSICAYGINTSGGATNPLLKCVNVTIG